MVNNKPVMSRTLFITLSIIWGGLLTFIGFCAVSIIASYYKKNNIPIFIRRHGYCYYIKLGNNWGGLNLGMFFITDMQSSVSTKWHEHGHAIQNCFWGPLMPFVITIPSAIRYWSRTLQLKAGKPLKKSYDSMWFEHDATLTGRKYRKHLKLS